MPSLFDTYSSDYTLISRAGSAPYLLPAPDQEAINKTFAIANRDWQIIRYLRNRVKGIFEIGCDAGHLIALAEFNQIAAFGIDICRDVVKRSVASGLPCSFGDMEILTQPLKRDNYHDLLHLRATKVADCIAFLNFSHVSWQNENSRSNLFKYAAANFSYILCSAYDDDIKRLELEYGLELVHSFSNWKDSFCRGDNLKVQYELKGYTCCLETYINLQKLFKTRYHHAFGQ
jgi:hypothetical protein